MKNLNRILFKMFVIIWDKYKIYIYEDGEIVNLDHPIYDFLKSKKMLPSKSDRLLQMLQDEVERLPKPVYGPGDPIPTHLLSWSSLKPEKLRFELKDLILRMKFEDDKFTVVGVEKLNCKNSSVDIVSFCECYNLEFRI